MTGIVGITALQELRGFKGFENAIVAGGFVRDSLLGGKVKDLDVFIPCASYEDFTKIVEQHFKKEDIKTSEIKSFEVPAIDLENITINLVNRNIDPWEEYDYLYDARTDTYQVKLRNVKKTKIISDIGNFKRLVRDTQDRGNYKETSKSYVTHYNCKYMDFLDVDIIGYVSKEIKDFNGNVIDFGDRLISEFSYNLDKVYYNGSETIQSKEFQSDWRNHTATLVKLESIEGLPHAMRKFERLREKYPHFQFRSTVLEVKQKEEEDKSDRKETYKSKYYTSSGIDWGQLIRR